MQHSASKHPLHWHTHTVDRLMREKLHQHLGAVLWFTGLSGSGKSTLAGALELVLHRYHISTYLLDGDNIRQGICQDLSFSIAARQENIRRIGEVAKLMLDAGLIVLTACISPQLSERDNVRKRLPAGRFVEIYVNTPLDICEKRDPKGLYRLARQGGLTQFTGIDSPYEPPVAPEIEIDGQQPIEQSIQHILTQLHVMQITSQTLSSV